MVGGTDPTFFFHEKRREIKKSLFYRRRPFDLLLRENKKNRRRPFDLLLRENRQVLSRDHHFCDYIFLVVRRVALTSDWFCLVSQILENWQGPTVRFRGGEIG